MRITGFHVDGFGLLHDQRVEGLGPGTTVVLGPNEAGKSTLHAFLVRTLFGHPRSNDAAGRQRHEPLAGGRHGGVVTCRDETGDWEVHRFTEGGTRLRVVTPDGREATGTDALLPLLGEAVDATRFEQVFAIDLDGLAGIGSLGDGALDDLLLDAATVGAGRSLRAARDEATARRDALWTPSARTRPLARAVDERAAARRALAEARDAAARDAGLRRRLDAAEARVRELGEAHRALVARRTLLERVRDAWPAWQEARAVERRLATPPPPGDAAALAVADEVAALVGQLGAHEVVAEQAVAAEASRDAAEREVAERLAVLGGGWDRDHVGHVDTAAGARERLLAAAAALQDAERAHDAAVAAAEGAEPVLEHRRAAPAPAGTTAQHDGPGTSRGAVAPALLAAGLVLLVPALLGLLPPGAATVLASVLGALAVGSGGFLLGRTARRVDGAGATHAAAVLDAEVATAARQAADAWGTADARAADLEVARTAWRDTCATVGLRSDEPGVVLAQHEAVAAAQRALREHEAAVTAHAALTPRLRALEGEAAAVAARLGREVTGRRAVALLPRLHDRVRAAQAAVEATRERRQQDEATLAAATATVDRFVGTAAAARTLLEAGDPTAWERELDRVADELDVLTSDRDDAIAERTDLAGRLDALGGDDAVARAAQACAAAEEEVATLAERWAVADAAATLLTATVEQVEREQQPRVLQRASELLARATGGHWTQVRRLEGRVVVARTAGGEPVPATVLSRGAREQLWCCLRLALAEDLTRDRPLPLLVDDLLGASDPARSEHLARVLADVARRHQVLLFTCDPRTAELVTSTDPGAAVLRLRRGGRVVDAVPGRATALPAASAAS